MTGATQESGVCDLATVAARTAGVTVRTVRDVTGIAAVSDFLSDVWQTPRSAPPYPAEVLHSVVHAAGAVHAAYDGSRLAGACVAVFGPPEQADAYSLVAAAAASDRGVGYAMKQSQRAWALERGARTMRWTFDPLVGRNARFNLVKLGATGTEYLVDFYGPMADGVNDGDESDRLTVTWDMAAPRRRTAEGDRDAAPATCHAPDGAPLARRDLDDRRMWCRVPDDIVRLRAVEPLLALRWRHAVREVFTGAFADGYVTTAMSRDGWYTLTRATEDNTPAWKEEGTPA
ncbi:chorismate synthase [Streptomyces sp. JV176]|uniref:chorismate synthase n=1 Tax=Streptomyces sp. JV176 TaxID=858630 RepID=UPI002E79857A|nr:chorismate synthase [Streptomyces sp. JV176]MEE1797653.1 chorismate synthase [Streptomyces sp. JV176]